METKSRKPIEIVTTLVIRTPLGDYYAIEIEGTAGPMTTLFMATRKDSLNNGVYNRLHEVDFSQIQYIVESETNKIFVMPAPRSMDGV